MAIVRFSASGGTGSGTVIRSFQPPKRADLKYWWKAAKKAMPSIPEWEERFRGMCEIDEQLITLDGGSWRLSIERKKHL